LRFDTRQECPKGGPAVHRLSGKMCFTEFPSPLH